MSLQSKLWTYAIAICVAVAQGPLDVRAAQKQTEILWYKTVQVKRVVKANRRVTRRLPSVQTLPLLTVQLRVYKRLEGGKKKEVEAQSVFETGDQVKVGITPNQSGYLYFILTNAQGGLLRNDRVFVRKDTELLCPSVCPDMKKSGGCFFTFTAPAPASGVEEVVIIFSRTMITNLPNNRREGESLIGRALLDEIKAKSGQLLAQIPNAWLPRGAPGRFAFLAQNTNTEDNEELVVTLQLKHRD